MHKKVNDDERVPTIYTYDNADCTISMNKKTELMKNI